MNGKIDRPVIQSPPQPQVDDTSCEVAIRAEAERGLA